MGTEPGTVGTKPVSVGREPGSLGAESGIYNNIITLPEDKKEKSRISVST